MYPSWAPERRCCWQVSPIILFALVQFSNIRTHLFSFIHHPILRSVVFFVCTLQVSTGFDFFSCQSTYVNGNRYGPFFDPRQLPCSICETMLIFQLPEILVRSEMDGEVTELGRYYLSKIDSLEKIVRFESCISSFVSLPNIINSSIDHFITNISWGRITSEQNKSFSKSDNTSAHIQNHIHFHQIKFIRVQNLHQQNPTQFSKI